MDFKLVNGDIAFDNLGRIKFVEGNSHIIQSIVNRLNTYKEELFYDFDYGIEPLDRLKVSQDNINYLQTIVERALLGDERILSVKIINVRKHTGLNLGKFDLTLLLTLQDGLELSLDYSIG